MKDTDVELQCEVWIANSSFVVCNLRPLQLTDETVKDRKFFESRFRGTIDDNRIVWPFVGLKDVGLEFNVACMKLRI